MVKNTITLFLLVVILFSSCVSSQKKTEDLFIYVTDSKKVKLLAPSALEKRVDAMQMFSGSFSSAKKDSINMIAVTECTEQKISVTMMNELGIEIASLLYTDSGVFLKSSFLPEGIKPEYIVMDFQNVYYRPSLLAKEYKTSGLSFTIEENDGIEKRLIMDGKTVIEVIENKDGEILLRNYFRGYTYRLTDLNSGGEDE